MDIFIKKYLASRILSIFLFVRNSLFKYVVENFTGNKFSEEKKIFLMK